MPRTREQIIEIVSKILVQRKVEESTWADLVNAVQNINSVDKTNLVRLLAESKDTGAGKILKEALYRNAESRALDEANILLADDTLSISELDRLL